MFNKYKPSDILWSIIFIVGFYVGVTSLGYGLLLGFVGHLKNIALGIFMLIVTILGLLDMYKKWWGGSPPHKIWGGIIMPFKKLLERNNRLKTLAETNGVSYPLLSSIMRLLVHDFKYEWEESFTNLEGKLAKGLKDKELEIIKINLERTLTQADRIRRKEELERIRRIKERRF